MRLALLIVLIYSSLSIARLAIGPEYKVSVPLEGNNFGYEYAAATVYHNGQFYRFYCSLGADSDPYSNHPDRNSLKKSWDFVRMRTSKNGSTWSPARVVMTPTLNNKETCACDPAIIHGDDGFWYLYYTGFMENYQTVTYVARSTNIQGPYFRYTERGTWEEYPSDPKPILKVRNKVKLPTIAYGAGQASVVKKNGKYHFWFTDVSVAPAAPTQNDIIWKYVYVVSSSPYKDLDKLSRRVITLDGVSKFPMNDFGDVKWNDAEGVYELWMTTRHFFLNNTVYLKRYVSKNGVNWTSKESVGPYSLASNVGMSGDENGWIIDGKTLVSFGAPDEGVRLSDNRVNYLRSQPGSVPGLPWSTYQFMVGGREIHLASLTNNTNGSPLLSYYQFPVKSSNMEFLSGDFDGDGITDLGAVDRNTSRWYILSSRYQTQGVPGIIPWGWKWPGMTKKHTIALGDYDGDGKTDRAIVDKENKLWYILSSEKPGQALVTVKNETIWGWKHPGINKMTHVLTGDYDGDGKSDIGAIECHDVLPTPSCKWNIISSITGNQGAQVPQEWEWGGMSSYHYVLEGDYDGDGKNDRAIVDNASGLWYIISSRTGGSLINPRYGNMFGWNWSGMSTSHMPIAGDFNGDGVTDMSMVSNDDMKWYTVSSSTQPSYFGFMLDYFKIGSSDYQYVVGDYDGDGISDCVVFDKVTSKVYFYTSLYKGSYFSRPIYHLFSSPNTGALKKSLSIEPRPVLDEGENKTGQVNPPKFTTDGLKLVVMSTNLGAEMRIFNMVGQSIYRGHVETPEKEILLPSKGMYIVRIGSLSSIVNIR